MVADVLKNGPAASAGIKIGDKIIQVNNQQITSASHLINYVALQALTANGKQQNGDSRERKPKYSITIYTAA